MGKVEKGEPWLRGRRLDSRRPGDARAVASVRGGSEATAYYGTVGLPYCTCHLGLGLGKSDVSTEETQTQQIIDRNMEWVDREFKV